ncbi:DNA replication licensing factor mcm family member [Anaeramoeba ignava]|uniref:DNA replication licensing factor mcm family member n=1 Tax=Anaeramoeba ignava TaxID=1746090 RepID=A0A9Q0LGH7_ANAIG|nr:DNA replication licensing factor mcm family member [Anaeramoeba ignava]
MNFEKDQIEIFLENWLINNLSQIISQIPSLFEKRNQKIWIINLKIDLMILADLNPLFAMFILKFFQPDLIKLTRKKLRKILQERNLIPFLNSSKLIKVNLRLKSLPFKNLHLQINEINSQKTKIQNPLSQLISFCGIVLQKEEPANEIYSKLFYCSKCKKIKIQIEKETEKGKGKGKGYFVCKKCYVRMKEDLTRREYIETQSILVSQDLNFKKNATSEISSKISSRTFIWVDLSEDLLKKDIPIGSFVNVIGFLQFQFLLNSKPRTGDLKVNANQIKLLNHENLRKQSLLDLKSKSKSNFDQIFLHFQNKKRKIQIFKEKLIDPFLKFLTPEDTFSKLKIALLVCLVSINQFHILVIGDHGGLIQEIIKEAISHNHCYYIHSVNKNSSSLSLSILMARDGILFVPLLEEMNKKDLSILKHAMEGEISINNIKTTTRCKIICQSYNHILSKTNQNKKSLPKNILDKFHLIVENQDKVDHGTDEIFSNQIFSKLKNEEENIQQKKDDQNRKLLFSLFIQFAQFEIKPQFTELANKLIQSYFVSCRKMMEENVFGNGNGIRPISLDSLTQISICIAQLSLSQKVTLQDAIISIWIFEENLLSESGKAFILSRQESHGKCSLSDLCLIQPKKDSSNLIKFQFQNFSNQLIQFCQTHTDFQIEDDEI